MTRLRNKAEKLLKYITDRKERADPVIPGEMVPRGGVIPKVNGTTPSVLNGIGRARSFVSSKSPSPAKAVVEVDASSLSRKDVSFPESSAIVRTQAGMSAFRQLDRELDDRLAGLSLENGFSQGWGPSLEEKLKSYGSVSDLEGAGDEDTSLQTYDGEIGEKRKL